MTDYEPQHLKLWTMPDHYFGAVWPDYYSAGVGQSRDSDALERSNFACMLEALGGEDDDQTVIAVRERHWAVGWVEWIAIHQDNAAALKIADDIKAKLENYPVINEDHFIETEQADADAVWRECYSPKERIDYVRHNRSQFNFHDYQDLLGCIRGKFFNGCASEMLT